MIWIYRAVVVVLIVDVLLAVVAVGVALWLSTTFLRSRFCGRRAAPTATFDSPTVPTRVSELPER